jgi:phage gpG-like protein
VSFTAEWRGLEELRVKFGRLPGATRQRLVTTVRDLTELVAETARANMARLFRGPVAQISTALSDSGEVITGTITAGGTPYAGIHEYGGTIHTPEIFPVHAQALHWVPSGANGGGGDVFARHTAAHDTRIPERSYLRSALTQREADIMAAFHGTVGDLAAAA